MRPRVIAGLAVAAVIAGTTVHEYAKGSEPVPAMVQPAAPAGSGPAAQPSAKAALALHIPHPRLLRRPYVLRRLGGRGGNGNRGQ